MADIMLDKLNMILTERNNVSANSLIKGYTFLNIDGAATHLDTSLANASANDIITGYSGYNNTEQLINGTNTSIDNIISNDLYVVNPVLHGTEYNLNNQLLVTPRIRATKYEKASTYFKVNYGVEAIEVLDDALLSKKVKFTAKMYIDNTLVNTNTLGFSNYILPSSKYRATGYNSVAESADYAIDKVNRIDLSFSVVS